MIRSAYLLASAMSMATVAGAQENVSNCDPDKRFFVLGSIVGAGQGLCLSHDPNRGATLSFSRDHQAGTSDGQVRATAAWRVLPATSLDGGLSYTSFVFASADGFFDGADGPNETRLGLYAELFHHSNASFAGGDVFLSYGLGAFALSDFDFDASGYGLTASVIPIVNSDRFGVNYIGDAGSPYLIARADLDMLWVDEAGQTGYADDTEYSFLEAQLGIGYSVPKMFDASLIYTEGRDLVSGNSYGGASANISLPVAGSDNLKLTLNYNNAEDRTTGNRTETTKLLLQFRF